MNMLFIKPFLEFMVFEIPIVFVFGHCSYSVLSPIYILYTIYVVCGIYIYMLVMFWPIHIYFGIFFSVR